MYPFVPDVRLVHRYETTSIGPEPRKSRQKLSCVSHGGALLLG